MNKRKIVTILVVLLIGNLSILLTPQNINNKVHAQEDCSSFTIGGTSFLRPTTGSLVFTGSIQTLSGKIDTLTVKFANVRDSGGTYENDMPNEGGGNADVIKHTLDLWDISSITATEGSSTIDLTTQSGVKQLCPTYSEGNSNTSSYKLGVYTEQGSSIANVYLPASTGGNKYDYAANGHTDNPLGAFVNYLGVNTMKISNYGSPGGTGAASNQGDMTTFMNCLNNNGEFDSTKITFDTSHDSKPPQVVVPISKDASRVCLQTLHVNNPHWSIALTQLTFNLKTVVQHGARAATDYYSYWFLNDIDNNLWFSVGMTTRGNWGGEVDFQSAPQSNRQEIVGNNMVTGGVTYQLGSTDFTNTFVSIIANRTINYCKDNSADNCFANKFEQVVEYNCDKFNAAKNGTSSSGSTTTSGASSPADWGTCVTINSKYDFSMAGDMLNESLAIERPNGWSVNQDSWLKHWGVNFLNDSTNQRSGNCDWGAFLSFDFEQIWNCIYKSVVDPLLNWAVGWFKEAAQVTYLNSPARIEGFFA